MHRIRELCSCNNLAGPGGVASSSCIECQSCPPLPMSAQYGPCLPSMDLANTHRAVSSTPVHGHVNLHFEVTSVDAELSRVSATLPSGRNTDLIVTTDVGLSTTFGGNTQPIVGLHIVT